MDDPIRLDKWLFHARLFKSRSLAAERIERGGIRVNGQPCAKPHRLLRPEDVITVATPGGVRVLRFLASGTRRGPAAEAATLYDDLTPQGGENPPPHLD